MSSHTGVNIGLTVFGESHGEAVGCVITGLCAGIPLRVEDLMGALARRKPQGNTGTQRREDDIPQIISGVYNGFTTGTPLTILIENTHMKRTDYDGVLSLLRPSHADYTGYVKYDGFADPRGGGHFSGRLTAPIVAAGAIFKKILRAKGIEIATHISNLADVADTPFSGNENQIVQWAAALEKSDFPAVDADAKERMIRAIENAAENKDSIGGILETAIVGMPGGIGEPIFGSVESVLSSLLFSVPGIKGVEFGLGFGFAKGTGAQLNDAFDLSDGQVVTKSNHNGGINGGISNGMPIVFRCAVKPTPSIFLQQDTVNIQTMETEKIAIHGRHDPAIIHRAAVVVESVAAMGMLDLFCTRYGYQWMGEQG